MKRITSILFVLTFVLSGIVLFSGFRPVNAPKESTVKSSSVKFKIKNAGFTVEGALGDLKAKIQFDAAELGSSSIDATVSTKTINTGNGTRDGHLRAEKYFDAGKYPLISLKSNSFTKQGNDGYIGRFRLTIKKITKDVAIPFTYTENNGSGSFKGSFTINRQDYGIGSSSMIMADNVTIMIEVNTTKR